MSVTTSQPRLGPERQLTACVLGEAMGTLGEGMTVIVGMGGTGVKVATSAASARVGTPTVPVGTSVLVAVTPGMLHAKTSMPIKTDKAKRRLFMQPPST